MSEQVTSLVDHYFREEYGKAVSYLTSKYGTQNLELAEDSVQEALIKAMQTWPYSKIPSNPSGWIVTVASNKMIDHFRRSSKQTNTETLPDSPIESEELDLDSIQDDLVKMMFACCHPSLSNEYQIILTLKILGGLSIKEISRALLKKEETVAKSYTRAKRKFQSESIKLELPPQLEIKNRLQTVLHIIYLLFTEGYKTTIGDELLKKDLCKEAIRLNSILLENDVCNVSATNALMALMHFHASRFDARIGNQGNLITLEHQDRSKWDQEMIMKGRDYLLSSTKGAFMNQYYIQATISGIHCEAINYKETKWSLILELYTILLRLNPSPIVQLNRVVALAKVEGAAKALSELERIERNGKLINYHILYAIKGEVLIELKMLEKAKEALQKAITLTENTLEKDHLKKKLESF